MKRLIAWAVAASLVCASLPASADAYDAAMARAAAAKEKALDANDAASWEEALLRFREADALRPTKESKYEVANAAAWLKQDDLAVEAYGEALALGLGEPARAKAEAFIADRQPKVAKLVVKGPDGATVTIDGRARGTLPRATPFVVFAGTINVRVESAKGARASAVTIAAGAESTYDGTPEAPSAPPIVPPPAPKPTPAPSAPPAEVPSNTLGWSLVVGGGVVAIAGVTMTIVAISKVNTYEDRVASFGCTKTDGSGYCTELPAGSGAKLADAQDASNGVATWRGLRTTGIVSAIGGSVVAVVGGVLLFNGKERAPRAGFAALPGGGFLTLSGSF